MSVADRSRSVVRWREREAPAVRLLCFPYAGGGASAFRTWPDRLGPRVDVCAVQLAGRESRLLEEPHDEVGPLVHELATTWAALLDVPFALFGHSLGALLAFELARELRREGLPPPVHLFASAHGAPHLPPRPEPIHALPDGEFVDALCRFGGTPPAVLADRELLELVVPALRADFALCERYRHRPEPPLDVPITVFVGTADAAVTEAEALAWRRHTDGAFVVRKLAGDHFFLRSAEADLVSAIATALADPSKTEPR